MLCKKIIIYVENGRPEIHERDKESELFFTSTQHEHIIIKTLGDNRSVTYYPMHSVRKAFLELEE